MNGQDKKQNEKEKMLDQVREKEPVGPAMGFENPYERLAAAILLRAADDYLEAQMVLKKDGTNKKARETLKDVESFLRSDDYRMLSNVDGGYLLKLLRKEGEGQDCAV